MSHPFLAPPERAAAFAYLVAHPHGSERRWAQALGWTSSKVHRFIAALIELKLGTVTQSTYGSTFYPLIPAEQKRSTSEADPEQKRSTSEAPHLEASSSRSLVSRCDEKRTSAEGERCIDVVNEILSANFKSSYELILRDNWGSHTAVAKWMAAGMSLDDMVRLLEEKARAFNPDKSGGKLPMSLAYFTRWILKAWHCEKSQLPLPLLSVVHAQPRAPARRPRTEPTAAATTVAEVMNKLAQEMGR